ncbi:MAG: acyltransferase [Clostridiales bacterium]|nr:acyltransferase [Clostridiales bacterium]
MAQARSNEKLTVGVLYGFRALMVLSVCNYHIWQQGWLAQQISVAGLTVSFDFLTRSGYLFVDGLLLLSGFLLYLPHAQAAAYGTPVPETKTFYQKRFIRIVPSYLASVLILLVFALNGGAYMSAGRGIADVFTHLTFTFTFFRNTYLYTPLNSVLWTIGIEVQFYLLFPLIVRFMRRKPALTLSLMAAAGLVFRAALGFTQSDLIMLVNQLPSFLDVYALGMLGAILYIRLRRWTESKPVKTWVAALSVPLFILSLLVLGRIFRFQSSFGANSMGALHRSQWIVRLPLAVTILAAMLSASFLPRVLQKLLDNRLMRFLSVISLNLYIWHQVLTSKFIRPFFPDTLHFDFNMQIVYTLICYSLSILTAMAFTYGLEHPAAKRLRKLFDKKGEPDHERPALTETR